MNCNLNLISLVCFQSSEAREDEIYLVFRGKKIWPLNGKFKELTSNSTQDINLEISNIQMNKPITIELWEHDIFFDDNLGFFEFLIDCIGGEFVTDLKRKAPDFVSRYSLKWSSKEKGKRLNQKELKDLNKVER